MSLRRGLLGLIAPVVLIALLAGCGGGDKSNGIDKLSASAALTKVKAAVADVRSVHVKGTVNQSGQPLTIEVFVGSDVAQGTIGVGGGTMDLRLVDGVTYFRGDAKVFAAFGANAAQASIAAGRWIKDSGTSGPAASFSTFLNRKQLFDDLLTPQGTISTGGAATVNGHKALILIDNSSQGGKLYVATTGAALPLRIARTGSGGGQIDFTDYNADVSVAAPAGAVDLSQLSGG
jgi:hypothetical protein